VWHIVSFSIFGASLVLLYAASTIYHSLKSEKWKERLQTLDHSAIFTLIAGTYTPFMLVSIRGPWGWSLFGVVWSLAVGGVIMSLFFAGRYRVVTTLLYVGMGWLIVVALKPMILAVPRGGLWLLLAGGLTYTFGTFFYLWRKVPYHHAIWHLFVLGGSVCHFLAVLFVLP
jgi:hemolysin III